jgi:hypothetical protein
MEHGADLLNRCDPGIMGAMNGIETEEGIAVATDGEGCQWDHSHL